MKILIVFLLSFLLVGIMDFIKFKLLKEDKDFFTVQNLILEIFETVKVIFVVKILLMCIK